MKKLYGIGTGPGDKELLTLKAVRSIESSSIIFAPNNNGKNMAVDTVKDFVNGKKIVYIDLPMGRVTGEDYKKAASTIVNNIPEGEEGAFLTIGDPMVYSTFIYIMEELEKDNIEIEIISGIPSFIAAAGAMKMPLTVKGDTFLLCDTLDKEKLEDADSIAILKSLKNKEKILDILEENKYKYKFIKRISFNEQEILEDKDEIVKEKDYMSLILARK